LSIASGLDCLFSGESDESVCLAELLNPCAFDVPTGKGVRCHRD